MGHNDAEHFWSGFSSSSRRRLTQELCLFPTKITLQCPVFPKWLGCFPSACSLAGMTWTPKAPTCPNMWVHQLWWRWDADLWRPSVPLANCDLPVRTTLKLAQRWWDLQPTRVFHGSDLIPLCSLYQFCFSFNLLPPAEWWLLGGLKQTLLPAGSLLNLFATSKCKR